MDTNKVLTKSEIRSQCRTLRQKIGENDYRIECRKIASQAALLPQLQDAKIVLSYWPKIEIKEIDLRPLNCWLRARGSIVLFPRIEPNSKKSRMQWGCFDQESTFMLNQWNILEPENRSEIVAEDIDVVLVPGLGFDRKGNRIGYGGGYYDRLFEYVDTFKIGLSLNCCLLEMIPTQSHDIPLDGLITSNRTFRFN